MDTNHPVTDIILKRRLQPLYFYVGWLSYGHCKVQQPWKNGLGVLKVFLEYYTCSPTRYTTFVMIEYLFTICLTA